MLTESIRLRRIIFVAASVGCVLASSAFALALFARKNWFGAGDLEAFFVCTAAFAVLLGALFVVVTPALWRRSALIGHVGSALVGLAAGYIFTLANALLLGPVFGAWSIPVLQCWLAGGLAGGVSAALSLERGRPVRALSIGLATAALLSGLWMGYFPAVISLSNDQELTVVFLKWTPSEEPLTIEDQRVFDRTPLGSEVISLLSLAGTSGHVAILGRSIHGQGPPATALVLLHQPILEPTSVRQPERASVLYVQGPDGLRLFPSDAKTIDREIELAGGPSRVWYSVRLANGGLQSGSAFNW